MRALSSVAYQANPTDLILSSVAKAQLTNIAVATGWGIIGFYLPMIFFNVGYVVLWLVSLVAAIYLNSKLWICVLNQNASKLDN